MGGGAVPPSCCVPPVSMLRLATAKSDSIQSTFTGDSSGTTSGFRSRFCMGRPFRLSIVLAPHEPSSTVRSCAASSRPKWCAIAIASAAATVCTATSDWQIAFAAEPQPPSPTLVMFSA